jgi:hypothetical protein
MSSRAFKGRMPIATSLFGSSLVIVWLFFGDAEVVCYRVMAEALGEPVDAKAVVCHSSSTSSCCTAASTIGSRSSMPSTSSSSTVRAFDRSRLRSTGAPCAGCCGGRTRHPLRRSFRGRQRRDLCACLPARPWGIVSKDGTRPNDQGRARRGSRSRTRRHRACYGARSRMVRLVETTSHEFGDRCPEISFHQLNRTPAIASSAERSTSSRHAVAK